MGPTRYVRTRDRRNMVRRFTDMLPGSRFYGVMRATRDMTGDNSKNRFARSVGMFESPHGAYPLANPTAMTLKDIRALPLGRWEQAKLYQGKRTEELDAQFKKTCPTERNHVWDAPNVTDASAHSAIIRDRTSTLAFIAFSSRAAGAKRENHPLWDIPAVTSAQWTVDDAGRTKGRIDASTAAVVGDGAEAESTARGALTSVAGERMS